MASASSMFAAVLVLALSSVATAAGPPHPPADLPTLNLQITQAYPNLYPGHNPGAYLMFAMSNLIDTVNTNALTSLDCMDYPSHCLPNITFSSITMDGPHYSDPTAAFPVIFHATFSGFAEGENFRLVRQLEPVNGVATAAAMQFAYDAYMSELSQIYVRGGARGAGIKILGPKVTPSSYYQRSNLDCWFDKAAPNRALAYNSTEAQLPQGNSLEKCLAVAAENNAAYFGIQWGFECWYSDQFVPQAVALSSAQKHGRAPNCDVTCTADSTQKCGGWYSYQLFELHPPSSTKDFTKDGFQAVQ